MDRAARNASTSVSVGGQTASVSFVLFVLVFVFDVLIMFNNALGASHRASSQSFVLMTEANLVKCLNETLAQGNLH